MLGFHATACALPLSPMPRTSLIALSLLSACGGSGTDLGPGVLITVDTTSADTLSVYGADPALTPALSALAARGVVYEEARTVTPITLPSHASMLTGLYPIRHTVRDNGYLPLPESADTLAERAQAAGYRTAAFVAAGVLTRSFGLGQGFDVYDEPAAGERATGAIADRRGRQITELAISWLEERQDQQPYFLWVHYFDPHAPYSPPPRFAEVAGGNAYLGEVATMDHAIGLLLTHLGDEPDFDRTTVVVVGDHGEAHGKNGEGTHGLLLHDATLHVPLIVRFPGDARAGERSAALTSVVDVYPTLLGQMGLGTVNGIDGVDLSSPVSRSGVYVENYHGFLNYGWAPISGWASASGLYIHGPIPRVEDEGGDLVPAPEGEDWVRGSLAKLERMDGRGALERRSDEARIAPDLSAFGYAGGGTSEEDLPPPTAPLDLPDPGDNIIEHDRIWAALAVADTGRLGRAIEQLQGLVAANPRNSFAADQLGELLIQAKRPADAVAVLEAVTSAGLERPSIRRRLSLAHLMLGDLESSQRELDRYEELCPGDPAAQAFREELARKRAASER